jgi:hypothetical protein
MLGFGETFLLMEGIDAHIGPAICSEQGAVIGVKLNHQSSWPMMQRLAEIRGMQSDTKTRPLQVRASRPGRL